ncbi:hypothetical protein NECID01_1091 [Nematocida sp. AWRm77]|nr:hypothetical protein NECID01_1091 [Nematocida sp. AWRm77]
MTKLLHPFSTPNYSASSQVSGLSEKKNASRPRTTVSKKALSEEVIEFLVEHPSILDRIQKEAAAIELELSSKKKKRRYSDQFRAVPLDRFSKELGLNRQAKLVHRFREEHRDIKSVTEQWREVLLASFEALVSYCAENAPSRNSAAEELYAMLALANAGISKEELGIEDTCE